MLKPRKHLDKLGLRHLDGLFFAHLAQAPSAEYPGDEASKCARAVLRTSARSPSDSSTSLTVFKHEAVHLMLLTDLSEQVHLLHAEHGREKASHAELVPG